MNSNTIMKEFADKIAVILFTEKVDASHRYNRAKTEMEKAQDDQARETNTRQMEYFDGCLREIDYIERKIIDLL